MNKLNFKFQRLVSSIMEDQQLKGYFDLSLRRYVYTYLIEQVKLLPTFDEFGVTPNVQDFIKLRFLDQDRNDVVLDIRANFAQFESDTAIYMSVNALLDSFTIDRLFNFVSIDYHITKRKVCVVNGLSIRLDSLLKEFDFDLGGHPWN